MPLNGATLFGLVLGFTLGMLFHALLHGSEVTRLERQCDRWRVRERRRRQRAAERQLPARVNGTHLRVVGKDGA